MAHLDDFHGLLHLRNEWTGFDLVKVGLEAPCVHRSGNLVVVAGCITTVSPMRQKANFDTQIGGVEHSCAPSRLVTFIAPTAMSRYEGVRQIGTSLIVRDDCKMLINFNKNTNPMVLHIAGLAYNISRDEPVPIDIAQYQHPARVPTDTGKDGKGKGKGKDADFAAHAALHADESDPPSLQVEGNIVSLQGSLVEATFGFDPKHLGRLPESHRPVREVRCLAYLVKDPSTDVGFGCAVAEQTAAVTLKPDGSISVQGGKLQMVDQKGNMRILQQKKKGRLVFDGIRFSLVEGLPLWVTPKLGGPQSPPSNEDFQQESLKRRRLGLPPKCTAGCIIQERIVLLEGFLEWSSLRQINVKQAIARLPEGCWPPRRLTFFTRGGIDLEERRRVDIDRYGRIFCPEGAPDGHVELSGIIFAREMHAPDSTPEDPDWDELKLQYNRTAVDVVSSSFDGHDLLEQFIRRCNVYEWKLMANNLCRHSGRVMLMPLGDQQVVQRGWEKGNEWNLDKRDHMLFKNLQAPLKDQFGITIYHTLLHLSDGMFDKVAAAIKMCREDYKHFRGKRRALQTQWAKTRESGIGFEQVRRLAEDIVDQMFEHWDFRAQLQGLLQNDFRAPKTIDHLFPTQGSWAHKKIIKEKVPEVDMKKFEEVRQFFYLYETTGSNMTHCSLMGAADLFTTTGKWHFPDAPEVQQQLFENVAWLFDREIYHYISERQTPHFPFIEDFDIQAPVNWAPTPPGKQRPDPPDDLIMFKPKRDEKTGRVYGHPGHMMCRRAEAIHMIYPNLDFLEVHVYSASGYNKGKEMLKSSFHLVWPQLIVNADRAPVIRYVTLGLFKKDTDIVGSEIHGLQENLLGLHESNEWELVFDSTTINARNGLRLPYSDKASMVVKNPEDKKRIAAGEISKNSAFKTRVVENRPSKAVGTIRFEFEKDERGEFQITLAQWTEDEKSYPKAEWIRKGSCRRDQGSASLTEVTPWQLGPEVMEMLPKRQGEKYYREADAEDNLRTHKPYPNVRRSCMETKEFVKTFNQGLEDEREQLKNEGQDGLFVQTVGSWISITKTQAIWKTSSALQFSGRVPDYAWGRGTMKRPCELIYLKNQGKVILDGPEDVMVPLQRVLDDMTEPDDHAIMPIYDITKMS
eukprot:TRINITY_DN29496_c0_g1_i1.p1 TRINITY_DN29496_c0_g1~~TRINITY_DN29496_c0_g1_i1.p1  ORF type:complete len:1155 (-),score=186.59 TRINITY_DN29496_c0_g1_i1:430-3831(-)